MPIALFVIVSQTMITNSIFNNFITMTAQPCAPQWAIFNHLSLKDWLFGVPKEELAMLNSRLAFGRDNDIENFWILMFLELDSIGFTIFVALFVGFLIHRARYAGTLNGWLLIGSALVINSSSNSLGV